MRKNAAPERMIDKDGYVQVLRRDHPRAHKGTGYVYEHILIVEAAMGKPLPASAQVHHANKERSDNRPRNLVACQDDAYHRLLHMRQEALDLCGHADWRRCSHCGEHDAVENMIPHAKGRRTPQYCHRICRQRYQRAHRKNRRAA